MTHILHAYDYTVTAFILSPAHKVLLVNHPNYKKWIPVGGHIELDENPEEALLREVKEETGFDVTILSDRPKVQSSGSTFLHTPNYLDVHEANPPHKHISFTYFVTSDTDEFTISEEHDDMKWFALDELEDSSYALAPDVKFFAAEAIKLAKKRNGSELSASKIQAILGKAGQKEDSDQ